MFGTVHLHVFHGDEKHLVFAFLLGHENDELLQRVMQGFADSHFHQLHFFLLGHDGVGQHLVELGDGQEVVVGKARQAFIDVLFAALLLG